MGLPTQDERDQRISAVAQTDPASTTSEEELTAPEQESSDQRTSRGRRKSATTGEAS
jgi:hypothetical protein